MREHAHVSTAHVRGIDPTPSAADAQGRRRRLRTLLLAVATSAFAATSALAVPVTIVDPGVNDVPGQRDLTTLTVDTGSNPLAVSWQWDETSGSGANTLDACALFDTDGDGNVNAAVCVSACHEKAREPRPRTAAGARSSGSRGSWDPPRDDPGMRRTVILRIAPGRGARPGGSLARPSRSQRVSAPRVTNPDDLLAFLRAAEQAVEPIPAELTSKEQR